ncbi:MAG: dienelactone hydrolase family protein [Rhodoblastus sp.]
MGTTLAPYEKSAFSACGFTYDVYRRGQGPAVVIVHEIPGLHPLVIRFADRVAEAGMSVYLPSLFGEPERPVSSGYVMKSLVQTICMRRTFSVWATDRSSPVVDWLRALARKAHAECGGPGVGALGMCLTGGFALAMMTEPAVIAPVLSQPSVPFTLTASRRRAIDASPEEISCARERFKTEGLSMIGLRFKGDPHVGDARFARYAREFGEAFERIEIDDMATNPQATTYPHSVLTVHLNDSDPDGPTKRAEARVIAFFKERLQAG